MNTKRFLFTLCTLLTISLTVSAQHRPKGFNYDETKVPNYTLPELLKAEDGSQITTADEWNKIRRPEVLKLFEDYVFGKSPAKPKNMTFKVTKSLPDALEGKARLKEVRIYFFEDDKKHFLDLLILLPKTSNGKVPIFLMTNFGGNHRIHPSKDISLTESWVSKKRGGDGKGKATETSRGKWSKVYSIDEILKNGYGLATYHCADLDPDRNNFTDGIHPYFYKEGQKKSCSR